MKISINEKFESKDELLEWLDDKITNHNYSSASIIYQNECSEKHGVNKYLLKGFFVEM